MIGKWYSRCGGVGIHQHLLLSTLTANKKRIRDHSIMLLVPIAIFWNYLSGRRVFAFMDIAADSATQLYPHLIREANRISAGEMSEGFSFLIGLGEREGDIFPNLSNWICFWGATHVAYLMGISVVIKMLLCGVLAYKLATLFGIDGWERMAISVGYETCSMLTARAAWETYPNLALVIILYLYCFESFIRHSGKATGCKLVGAILVFCFNLSVYMLLFYGCCLAIYSLFRLFQHGLISGRIIKCCCAFLFGIVLLFAYHINDFKEILHSWRYMSGMERLAEYYQGSEKWVDTGILHEVFTRMIGQTIGGVNEAEFLGRINFLEGPTLYMGITSLVMLPVAIVNIHGKNKTFIIAGLILALCYLMLPPLTLIASGFAGTTYKISSFWITCIHLYTMLVFFSSIDKKTISRKTILLLNLTIVLCIVLLIRINSIGMVARGYAWVLSFVYLVLYGICFNVYWVKNTTGVEHVIMLLIVSEAIILSRDIYVNRIDLTSEELNTAYYDDLYYAINETKINDGSWYRIEKRPISVLFSDSLIQDYYGTRAYIGGLGYNAYVVKACYMLGLPTKTPKRIYGTTTNVYANSLFGVKYIIQREVLNTQHGIELVDERNGVYIYRNELALPLAYAYDQCYKEKQTADMTDIERGRLMLNACVVDDDYRGSAREYSAKNTIWDKTRLYRANHTDENGVKLPKTEGRSVLVVMPVFSEGKYSHDRDLYVDDIGEGNCIIRNYDGTSMSCFYEHLSSIEVTGRGIDSIQFDKQTSSLMSDVIVYAFDEEEYYEAVDRRVTKLKREGMKVTMFDRNRIEGTIDVEKPGILASSIPFDEKWEILIDGIEHDTFKVNYGFLGTDIDPGKHEIIYIYNGRSRMQSNLVKLILISTWGLWAIFLLLSRKKSV